jgi:hypothetical protein
MESVLDTRNSSFECGLVTNILARGCECFSFYFNIFTKNGDESEKLILLKQFSLIKRVIAFESFKTKINSEGMTQIVKSAVKGYIFVESEGGSFQISPELYHFLKKIPLVCKVLQFSIGEQEFNQFFERVDVEEEVEVILEDSLETAVEEFNELVTEQNCKAALRRKKPVFKMTVGFMNKIGLSIHDCWVNGVLAINDLIHKLKKQIKTATDQYPKSFLIGEGY